MLVHNSLRFAPIVNLFRADCQALFTDVIELCLMRFAFLTVIFELKPDEKIILELGKVLVKIFWTDVPAGTFELVAGPYESSVE